MNPTPGQTANDLAARIAEKLFAHTPSNLPAFIAAVESELAPTLDELTRLRAADVPICVGQPIIQILAREDQWISESGAAVIAASDLSQHDPYDRLTAANTALRTAREALAAISAGHPDGNPSLLHETAHKALAASPQPPTPPLHELTQPQLDEEALDAWRGRHGMHYDSELWHAALAWEREQVRVLIAAALMEVRFDSGSVRTEFAVLTRRVGLTP